MVGIKGKSGVYKRTEYHRRICSEGHKGQIVWNKGLTKETDERVRNNVEKSNKSIRKLISEGKINPAKNLGKYSVKGCESSFMGKHHSEESKVKIGKNSGMHNSESRDKLSKTIKKLFNEGKRISPMKGKYLSEESKKKISESLLKAIKEGRVLFKIKGKTYEEFYGKERAIEIKNKIFSKENREAMLKSLIKRPTSYEKKISELLIEYGLPFIYTGNGTFLIGHKNPDFVNEEGKIAIEVYNNYFKIRDFGSCEEYEKQRGEYFSKYGWKTIFIRTEEVMNPKWKEVCLNKIGEAR